MSLERFSERNTAFNAVSRDMGVSWQGVFHNKALSLVRDGKMEPKREFEDADEALLYYAYGIGFETVNETTVSWGSGKSNRGALTWEQPRDIPPEVLAQRPTDGKRLRRYLGSLRQGLAHCALALPSSAQSGSMPMYSVTIVPLMSQRLRRFISRKRQLLMRMKQDSICQTV